jgi:hypothetical protein
MTVFRNDGGKPASNKAFQGKKALTGANESALRSYGRNLLILWRRKVLVHLTFVSFRNV